MTTARSQTHRRVSGDPNSSSIATEAITVHTPPRRADRHRRWRRAGIGAAIAAVATVAMGAAPAAADRIGGDHHSPTVVWSAAAALAAQDAFAGTGTPGAFVTYLSARDAAADAVALEMGLDPVTVRGAWARADSAHQEAVLAALSQLGKPYRFATSDPGVGFDCSGLTAFAWSRAGVEIPHQSSAQIGVAARR